MTATIVGNSSTQSRGKRPGKQVVLSHCSGAYEYSVDGRKILSWPSGQYGGLLGYPSYDNPLTSELIDLLNDVMKSGRASLGSYVPDVEQKLADKLVELYAPYLRSKDIGFRAFSNGTDATQCAVALARYATGRDLFVSVGYHGGSSPTFTFKPQNGGVLVENSEYRYDIDFDGDLSKIEYGFFAGAGTIVEVPSVEDENNAASWLHMLSRKCMNNGLVFILDDIVTGFRYAPAGALQYYSQLLQDNLPRMDDDANRIKADFVCLGKAISTYGKISALLGPRDIMDALKDRVFASFTYSDAPLGFYDSLWTLEQYEEYHDRLYSGGAGMFEDDLWEVGSALKFRLNYVFKKYSFPAKCIGHPARSAIVPIEDDNTRTGLQVNGERLNTLLARVVDEYDVLLHRPQFVTLAHTLQHVDQTLNAVEGVLKSWQ